MNLGLISFFIGSLLFLTSCSSGNREELKEYRTLYVSGQYDQAIELLKTGELAQNPDSKLLYFMELGSAYFAKGDYGQSAQLFEQALAKANELYTVRISKKLKTFVGNDNYSDFYGNDFERSYLYYHAALSHLKFSQTPGLSAQQKQIRLRAARSQIMAWDSFFKTIQRNREFKTVYFNDLMAKVLGSVIHESFGTRAESEIAFVLAKDAYEMAPLLIPNQKSFNRKYKKFRDGFLESITENKPQNAIKTELTSTPKLFSKRSSFAPLIQYVNERYLRLAKKMRPKVYNRIKTRPEFSQIRINRGSKNTKRVAIVLNAGMVAQKKPKLIDLSLRGAFSRDSSAAARIAAVVGHIAFSHFAYNVLGLAPRGRRVSYARAYNTQSVTNTISNEAAIAFEVPDRKFKPKKEKMSLLVHSSTGQVVAKKELPIVSSLSSLSLLASEEEGALYVLKKGVRVVVKHSLAVLTAYSTYMGLKGPEGGFLAKSAALAAYVAGAKAVSYSEKADVRYWSSLPEKVNMTDLELAPGNYLLKIEKNGQLIELGSVKVESQGPNIFSYRVPKV